MLIFQGVSSALRSWLTETENGNGTMRFGGDWTPQSSSDKVIRSPRACSCMYIYIFMLCICPFQSGANIQPSYLCMFAYIFPDISWSSYLIRPKTIPATGCWKTASIKPLKPSTKTLRFKNGTLTHPSGTDAFCFVATDALVTCDSPTRKSENINEVTQLHHLHVTKVFRLKSTTTTSGMFWALFFCPNKRPD